MFTSKEGWFEKMEEFMAKGMSAQEAMLKVKAEHPELKPLSGLLFEDKVAENFSSGLGKMAAVQKAAIEYPNLYLIWQKRLSTGKNNSTIDLFQKR
jgi:hypothetical protein